MSDERFKRMIHLGSRAARNVQGHAAKVVSTFLEHVTMGARPARGKRAVGEAQYDVNANLTFTNSVHPMYSGLNPDEVACARAIDRLGWPWYRNPSNGGFFLPLLEVGTTRSFFPDFIVWTDAMIWLIDPKGEHLVQRDAGRKIITIENDSPTAGQRPLKVCLITKGKWAKEFQRLPSDKEVVTAWQLRAGKPFPTSHDDWEALLQKIVGAKAS